MTSRARALLLAILAAAAVWHVLVLLAPEKQKSPKDSAGRDFASYYYGAVVAEGGGDPYDRQAILDAAANDGLRANVHPFFYPPPYLLVVAWAPAVDLLTGFQIWKILDEIATLLCGLALWTWWRDLGRRPGSDLGEIVVPSAIALLIALLYPVEYGHQMGQANFLVLLFAVTGLWQDQKRPVLAGILMGVACMLKMSPALFVLWWAMHRQWKAVGAAVATGVVLSILVLPICGLGSQIHFYTQILPEFGTGNYNGLTIRIDMFGNHSLPNIYEQLWPGDQTRLSPPAQAASTASALALIAGLAWLFRKPAPDALGRGAQAAAIAAVTLLVPVYTYEHHLVWAIPGLVLAIAAAWQRRLHPAFWIPLGLSIAAFCYPLPDLKDLSTNLLGGPVGWVVQESKFFAIWVVLAACATVGASRSNSDR